jgi:PAS domain S-box-containing protein
MFDRKKTKENLKESEIYLDIMGDALMVLDSKARMVKVNKSFSELWGYNTDEVIGKPVFGMFPEEELPKHQTEMENTAKEGGVRTFETIALTKDKKEINVSVSGDITERKRAEEKLKEYSERLEEMLAERTKELSDAQEKLVRREKLVILGQLAGGIGHELRNPLGAIKNAAYFLNMALEKPEQEVKETLDLLEKEVSTSERIISSLLGFARPKPPSRHKVDVQEVIDKVVLRTAIPEGIKIVTQSEKEMPHILADSGQLSQIFGNIVLNSIQAMPEGGKLVIESRLDNEKQIAISFTDTGEGIPKEIIRKLFEPLFTTKTKGVGLGLAVTKSLVEGHGGKIKVKSKVGIGSTFIVKLPASTEPKVANMKPKN